MIANGTIEAVFSEACLPTTFSGTNHSINFKLIPGLTDTCELGIDFAEKFGFGSGLRDKNLWLANEPIIKFDLGPANENDIDTFKGIAVSEKAERVQN